MRFGKGITRKRLNLSPKFTHQVIRVTLGFAVVEEAFCNLFKFRLVAHLMPHHTAQHISLGQVQACKIMPHLQHILLINHHTVGLGQKFLQYGMFIVHCFRMMEAIDVFSHHARFGYTWSNDGTGCDQGFVVTAAQLSQQSTHGRTLDVKTATGLGFE